MTQTLTLTVHRSNLLTSNERRHRMNVAAITKTLRHAAGMTARAVGLVPMTGPVRILVTVAWPDRRRRDVPNIYPTVKACVDGIVDAGVLTDDDDGHVESMTFRRSPELSGLAATTRIAITLEEVRP